MVSAIAVITLACWVALAAAAPAAPVAREELQPMYVRAKLVNFAYTGNGCDPFGNKCDTQFKIKYSWLGQSEDQHIPEYSETHSMNFDNIMPRVFTGPFPAGSQVIVDVRVEDVDFDSNDHMATFKFVYNVPENQPADDQLIELVQGKNTMRIMFRTIFL